MREVLFVEGSTVLVKVNGRLILESSGKVIYYTKMNEDGTHTLVNRAGTTLCTDDVSMISLFMFDLAKRHEAMERHGIKEYRHDADCDCEGK